MASSSFFLFRSSTCLELTNDTRKAYAQPSEHTQQQRRSATGEGEQ